MKSSVQVAVAVVVLGAIVYVATHWSELKDRFFGDHAQTTTEGAPNSDGGTGAAGNADDKNANGAHANNPGANNADLSFNNTGTLPPELKPTDPKAETPKIVNGEDPSEPCPTQTNKYRRVMPCPKVPQNVKNILKKMNFKTTKEDCELESRTSRITLGNNFIAWTVMQTNSCENKAFPQGLSEEKTYNLKDGSEVVFGDHFDLNKLEAYYLSHYEVSTGVDEDGQKCLNPKESNRRKRLGALDSELTKAQFRMVDNNRSVKMEIQTFYPTELGKICSLRHRLSDWNSMLLKDSKFQKNQKPGQIGESE